jgi:hypothetical protein
MSPKAGSMTVLTADWLPVSVLIVDWLPVCQVGNLGLLFMLLFFIYAALGVELFGELGESVVIVP